MCGREIRGLLSRMRVGKCQGFPSSTDGKAFSCNAGDLGSIPRLVGKIPWRKKWQPTPVFLPGESHAQKSLVGYSPWSRKELDTTEWLTDTQASAKKGGDCSSKSCFPGLSRSLLCQGQRTHLIPFSFHYIQRGETPDASDKSLPALTRHLEFQDLSGHCLAVSSMFLLTPNLCTTFWILLDFSDLARNLSKS